MNWKPLSLIVTLVLVTGCSARSSYSASPASKKATHEVKMQSLWIGRTYAELIQEKGSNGMQMTIPGTNSSANFVVVYDTDSESGCLDTFRIIQGKSAIINDYFCR